MLPSRGLGLRPIGKSSECFQLTVGVKSGAGLPTTQPTGALWLHEIMHDGFMGPARPRRSPTIYAPTLDHEAPVCAENSICIDLMASAVWRFLDRHDSIPSRLRGKRGPPSVLRNGRGGALAEQFGSVTRSFPWSVIAVEALSPMVFIHTRRIIIVPSHQYLLGFFPPLFESHRRLVSYICVVARRLCSRSPGKRLCIIPFWQRASCNILI